MWSIYFPIIVSIFAIIFVYFTITKIRKAPVAKDKAIAITEAIQEGAISYLKRQYKTVSVVAIVLFFVIWIFFSQQSGFAVGFKMAIGFLIGAILSGVSGFIGMLVSTQTNTRAAAGAKKGLADA